MTNKKGTSESKLTNDCIVAAASETPSAAQSVPVPPTTDSPAGQTKPPTDKDLFAALIESLGSTSTEEKNAKRDDIFHRYLLNVISSHVVSSNYNILIIYDESRLVKSDADRIYSAVSALQDKKPLLVVVYSTGGSIASAYLIGKLCREYAKDRFVAVVPRQAKSAATLLCCAADEIHMGSLSELGPIDPQIVEF